MRYAYVATLTGCVGFLGKIKKVLETVCHNCGKILVDEVSQPGKEAGVY